MAFYVKRQNELLDAFTNSGELVKRFPEAAHLFDALAEERKIAWDRRTPTSWGAIMGAGEYRKVASIPKKVWYMMNMLKDAGLAPDPLRDDAYFYGFLLRNPGYQAHPMKR